LADAIVTPLAVAAVVDVAEEALVDDELPQAARTSVATPVRPPIANRRERGNGRI
jgi:hypothetical protein